MSSSSSGHTSDQPHPPTPHAPGNPGSSGAATSVTPTPDTTEALRRRAEATRAEVVDTVEALAAKADVKGRARAKAHDTRQRAQRKAVEVAGEVQTKAGQVQRKAGEVQRKVDGQVRGAAHDNQRALAAAGATILVLIAGVIVVRHRRGRR